MSKVIENYRFGDMQAVYVLDEATENPELVLLPADMEYREPVREKSHADSLVQVKLAGDTYPGGYAGGVTLRQSKSTEEFRYIGQNVEKVGEQTLVHTDLAGGRGGRIVHHLGYTQGEKSLWSWCTFYNEGTEAVSLELLSSFSLGKISPYLEGDGHEGILMHRLRSVWSMEGRLETRTLEELQLEPSWSGHAVRAERFGQAGSMPVNRYFPSLVLEDHENHIFWGAQLAHNASWQMEVYRKGDDVQMSGGLADREFGHWLKTIAPGESFSTPRAILSVCHENDIDVIFQRLTDALEAAADAGPACEQELPIIFNEYCTTWGCPSHENISEIVAAIKDRGFSYFVIDCGWYKQEGVPWDVSMGDYQVSKELFPEGMQKTVDLIKENGMKPGIWFEIDNVGPQAKAYQMTEHLLKRDGYPLTTATRRFWDMRQPWVQEYLADRVIGTLKKYGFEYMKMDYNDTIGIGCDGCESLGEGLRQNMEASVDFIRRVKEEIPGIVLENCASGGHKLEPLMMSECSMASFSDAHECEEIPIIAANLHRAILPRQSQIWAVIRKTDSLKRIAYSVANTFLGRMCISGDVWQLSDKQWQVVDAGIAFYKKIAPVIKKGYTSRFGPEIKSYRHPEGWQGILRVGENGQAFALFHAFHGAAGRNLSIPLPEGYVISDTYSYEEEQIWIEDGQLQLLVTEDSKAVAVYLEKKS
jgi:alpha-galactosidase